MAGQSLTTLYTRAEIGEIASTALVDQQIKSFNAFVIYTDLQNIDHAEWLMNLLPDTITNIQSLGYNVSQKKDFYGNPVQYVWEIKYTGPVAEDEFYDTDDNLFYTYDNESYLVRS